MESTTHPQFKQTHEHAEATLETLHTSQNTLEETYTHNQPQNRTDRHHYGALVKSEYNTIVGGSRKHSDDI
jgi:hypothetical protein